MTQYNASPPPARLGSEPPGSDKVPKDAPKFAFASLSASVNVIIVPG